MQRSVLKLQVLWILVVTFLEHFCCYWYFLFSSGTWLKLFSRMSWFVDIDDSESILGIWIFDWWTSFQWKRKSFGFWIFDELNRSKISSFETGFVNSFLKICLFVPTSNEIQHFQKIIFFDREREREKEKKWRMRRFYFENFPFQIQKISLPSITYNDNTQTIIHLLILSLYIV